MKTLLIVVGGGFVFRIQMDCTGLTETQVGKKIRAHVPKVCSGMELLVWHYDDKIETLKPVPEKP